MTSEEIQGKVIEIVAAALENNAVDLNYNLRESLWCPSDSLWESPMLHIVEGIEYEFGLPETTSGDVADVVTVADLCAVVEGKLKDANE